MEPRSEILKGGRRCTVHCGTLGCCGKVTVWRRGTEGFVAETAKGDEVYD